MPIFFKSGNMFDEPVEALVNTVNCVGVMGKGVALEFKNRWPDNFRAYKKLCDAKQLNPGQMFVYDTHELFFTTGPRYLVNFPTKAHWRSKSKLSYIEDGLENLVDVLREYQIESIAMPPLGCGNGGLDWAEVKPLIEAKLSGENDVKVIVFEPQVERSKPEHIAKDVSMTAPRAILLKTLSELEYIFDGSFDRISLQKIVYFLQALRVDFNLKFSRNMHGPYSETLRSAFVSLEKLGMISGFTGNNRQTSVTNIGCAAADDFLSHDSTQSDDLINKLSMLIQGYESPYGLELLSSVHWLAHHEKHQPVEQIIEQIMSWTDEKRNSFTDQAIRTAYDRLQEDGLLN
ncbi:MAG: Appr-1-p processing protein [Ponticaulis sp.]|nr:Appr-1-p processing protein [Ponticaulis sp.]